MWSIQFLKLNLILVLVLILLNCVNTFVVKSIEEKSKPYEAAERLVNLTSDELDLQLAPLDEDNWENGISKEFSDNDQPMERGWTDSDEIDAAATGQAQQIIQKGISHIERGGEKLSNFVTNAGTRLLKHNGNVVRTLEGLQIGIQVGANALQNFIMNFHEKQSTRFRVVLERITSFFHNTLSRIRAVFDGIKGTFQRLIQSVLNRDKPMDGNLVKGVNAGGRETEQQLAPPPVYGY